MKLSLLEQSVTEATGDLFQDLVTQGRTLAQFDGARVDPPQNPIRDKWIIGRCMIGPRDGKADAHETWALGLIGYRQKKSETSRLVTTLKALGIDLEEVLNAGSHPETLRTRVMKELLGDDFDPKNPHAKDVSLGGSSLFGRNGIDWAYENTEFGLLSREDQLFVIDWYTRADAFNGKDMPDGDPTYQDKQTQYLTKIIVPLREAVEGHAKIYGQSDDQQRLGQSVLVNGLRHDRQAAHYDERAAFAEKRADKREKNGQADKAAEFRREAEGYRQKAAEARKKAAPLIQLAVEIDPSNATAQRKFAEVLLRQGDHTKAKAHLALAVTSEKDPKGFEKTVAVAQYVKDSEIGNGWDFVINRLTKENRLEEASAVSKSGYGNPQYYALPGTPSGKVQLALVRAGVAPSTINAGHAGPVTVRQLWNYVGKNFDDPVVSEALKVAGIPTDFLPKDHVKFDEMMAAHFVEKAGQATSAREKADYLVLAIHYQPRHADHYVKLGDLYFAHQDYKRAHAAYQGAIAVGMPEAAYLGAGRCCFMMGDLSGASAVYADYLRLNTRSVAVRTARLEMNLMRLTTGGASTKDVGDDILQDQAMLRFLNPAADRAEMTRLATDLDPAKAVDLEKKAQEFLLLGGVAQTSAKDADELGNHYAGLAAEAYRTLHQWASKSSDSGTREMSFIYLANVYASEGKMDEAEKTYQSLIDSVSAKFGKGTPYIGNNDTERGRWALQRIQGKHDGEAMVALGEKLVKEGKTAEGQRLIYEGKYKIDICHPYTEEPSPAVVEAMTKLGVIQNDRTRSFHLAAVDFWEGIQVEQEKAGGKDGTFEGVAIGGKKITIQSNNALERRLIAAVREKLAADKDATLTLSGAIEAVASDAADPALSSYASMYVSVADAADSRPANVIGYLLAYTDQGFPPSKKSSEALLEISYKVEQGGFGQVAMGGYQFVSQFSSDKDVLERAEKRIRVATGDGSFWENVERVTDTMTPEDIARDLVVFGGIGRVGTLVRLATSRKLIKSGEAAWKVWLYSRAAEVAVAGTGFFLYGTHQELQHGDPDKILTFDHLARRYGASIVLMGFSTLGREASAVVGESQFLQWGAGHLGSVTGMVGAGYANRLFHLEEGPLADYGPLAGALVLYPVYAAGGALAHTPGAAKTPVGLRGVSEARLFFGLEGEITPTSVERAYTRFQRQYASDRMGGREPSVLKRAAALRDYLLRDVCGAKASKADGEATNPGGPTSKRKDGSAPKRLERDLFGGETTDPQKTNVEKTDPNPNPDAGDVARGDSGAGTNPGRPSSKKKADNKIFGDEPTGVDAAAAKKTEDPAQRINQETAKQQMVDMARRIKGLWDKLVQLKEDMGRGARELENKDLSETVKNDLKRQQDERKAQWEKYGDELDVLVKQFRQSQPDGVDPSLWSSWEQAYKTVAATVDAAETGMAKLDLSMSGEPMKPVQDQISFVSSGHLGEFEITQALFTANSNGGKSPVVAATMKVEVKPGADIPKIADAVIKSAETSGTSGYMPKYLPKESQIGAKGAVLVFGDAASPGIRWEIQIQ